MEEDHCSHVCLRRPGSRGYRPGHPAQADNGGSVALPPRRLRCRVHAGWDQIRHTSQFALCTLDSASSRVTWAMPPRIE
jgi:hypothetical protein